jgi:hypothetical protein
MDTMTLRHWCTWYIAASNASAYRIVGDATSFPRDKWFSRRKLGSFDIKSLVWVGFSSKLQVGCKLNLVPNVAKNMTDLIKYIFSLFCRAPRSFKGSVKFPRLVPMRGIIIIIIIFINPQNWGKLKTHYMVYNPKTDLNPLAVSPILFI